MKLRQGPYSNTRSIYAAPHTLTVGDSADAAQIAAELKQTGYSESSSNLMGHYRLSENQIEIYPGSQSYFRAEPAAVHFRDGHLSEIILIDSSRNTDQYNLEAQLIVDLSAAGRAKRRFVQFDQIPKVLVNAVLSAEDKHFSHHPGIDPVRIVTAAYVNLRSGRKEQGGSTLTMQLARNLLLDAAKEWRRKATEVMITLVLEQRLSKKQIFEYYSNQIYLGRHESFDIHGFGEAARVNFNKDLEQLTLPDAALLAGMVQRPSYFDPLKHPERAVARRNVVLAMMRQNGYITASKEKLAARAPAGISEATPEHGDAPYFLTLATEELEAHLASNETDDSSFRLYTTLDPRLQCAAVEAVGLGMKDVDLLLKRKGRRSGDSDGPQVALVALDPHTGEVKALVGGRN